MEHLADFNIHDSLFENFNHNVKCQNLVSMASIELSLKADGIQIFPLAK